MLQELPDDEIYIHIFVPSEPAKVLFQPQSFYDAKPSQI